MRLVVQHLAPPDGDRRDRWRRQHPDQAGQGAPDDGDREDHRRVQVQGAAEHERAQHLGMFCVTSTITSIHYGRGRAAGAERDDHHERRRDPRAEVRHVRRDERDQRHPDQRQPQRHGAEGDDDGVHARDDGGAHDVPAHPQRRTIHTSCRVRPGRSGSRRSSHATPAGPSLNR
ncbi:hypothetical protein OG912_00025 [Streptomyces sp. NBC_00464]